MAQGATVKAARPRPARRTRERRAPRGHEPRGSRVLPDQEGDGRYDGNVSQAARGARAEPQRAVPPAADGYERLVSRRAGRRDRALRLHDRRMACRRRADSTSNASSCWRSLPRRPARSCRSSCSGPATTPPKVQWTLTRRHRRRPVGFIVRAARARRAAAADARQPAGGAARGRLLDSRPRRRAATTRWRGQRRGQRARRDAARAAARRARSHGAAAQGHGGDRRRRLHLRRAPAAAAGEPRRRAAARRAGRAAARSRPTSSGWPTGSKPTRRASSRSRFRAARPLGGPAHDVPAARPAAPLLVLTDVSKPLREEERQAWQRLIRVLGHELNNSLAPIKSIAGSLGSLVAREPQPPDWKEDMARPRGHRDARRSAQPLHGRLRAPGAPAAAAARSRSTSPRCVERVVAARDAAARPSSRPRHRRSRPTATSSTAADQPVKNAVEAATETQRRRPRRLVATGSGAPYVEIDVDDEGPGLRTRRTSSSRSSPPSPPAPASGSSSAARSPRPTAARSP